MPSLMNEHSHFLLNRTFFLSMADRTIAFLLLFFISLHPSCCKDSSPGWIRGGYWDSVSELPISEINSALFTHLMCGFARINSTYHIFFNSTSEQSFYNFATTVKRKNPSVVTLLSIWGGGQDSSIFSSMINESSSRKTFIKSSIETARLYGFHGLDLAGVKPNRTINMTNLGTLFDEWRDAVNSEARNSGKSELLLVITSHHLPAQESVIYPIESLKKNLNWIHVLAYDYYLPTRDNFTGNHAALYSYSSWFNTNNSISEWLSIGIEAHKLVLGLPYHGYAWRLISPTDNAIGAPASGPSITIDGSIGYKFLKSFIRDYGYGAAAVYNHTYVVNIFTVGTNWINFDGVDAIRAKVSYAREKGLLGYNVFQLSNDDKWELSSAAQKESTEDRQDKRRFLIIVLVTIAALMLLLGTIICCFKKILLKATVSGIMSAMKSSISKLKIKVTGIEIPNNDANKLQVFTFITIKAATNNFSSDNKLGEGGYGPVYKGKLPKGQEIAVKRLSETSHQGPEEFKNEVELTARLQHVNLLPVSGICTQKEEKILVYEYMPNKSLDFYIFDSDRWYLLDWQKRVRIIEGITQGLLYLQEYSNITIVHRDLKASNILLDGEMNPKISDFGMARAFKKHEYEANTRHIVGTYGYVPPEYVRKGIYSIKYDVYSYGVLLLQIISGKRTACYYGSGENLNLLEYGYGLWREGKSMKFFDSSLDDSSSSLKLKRCMEVALLCVQEIPADRPTMLRVCNMLKNESADIPSPKKPAFSIRRDEHEYSNCIFKEKIFSVNDTTITQPEPR